MDSERDSPKGFTAAGSEKIVPQKTGSMHGAIAPRKRASRKSKPAYEVVKRGPIPRPPIERADWQFRALVVALILAIGLCIWFAVWLTQLPPPQ